MERFIKTYTKKKTLLGLALGMCEGTSKLSKCSSSVYECKSKVNEVLGWYLYQRGSDKRENSCPSSNKNPQPLDPHRVVERGEHGAKGI